MCKGDLHKKKESSSQPHGRILLDRSCLFEFLREKGGDFFWSEMTGERGAAVLTGHSRLSAPEISAKILLKKKACCIKRLTKASPVFFALLFCIFGNRGGLPFDVARYLLGLYKQRKSKKKSISEIPGAIFRKRNPNTVLPRHRHRQKPENDFSPKIPGATSTGK